MQDEDKALRRHFRSKSRNVARHRDKTAVSLRYDDSGKPLTEETFDARKHLKLLDQNDWRFLEAWKRHDYNSEKAGHELNLSDYSVKALVKKLEPFRLEELHDKALAQIPTSTFIQARHVENLYQPIEKKLSDSDQKSLQELAKIQGAYKNTNQINIQNNVFQMPSMTPEQQAELKALGDRLADVVDAEVAHG